MGGASFLLNKKFHPARLDNQKTVFLAEEKLKLKKQREEEAAKEIMKEKELLYYENLGDIKERDARQSSLKFMYAVPAVVSKNNPVSRINGNEDPLVQAFWSKIKDKQAVSSKVNDSNNTSSSIKQSDNKKTVYGDITTVSSSTSTIITETNENSDLKQSNKRPIEDEEEESDPEAEFIATLTSREKKLLLKKLQKLQDGKS